MAYKIHVGEDNGKTQALWDKLVDSCSLYEIERSPNGYMKMRARSIHGGMSELEVERLCVKYFHTTDCNALELHVDEYTAAFHKKEFVRRFW